MKNHILIFFVTYCTVVNLFSQSKTYKFSQDKWNVFNAENKIIAIDTIVYKDEHALRLKNNEIAHLQDVTFDNFRLDVDMAGVGMAGIGFRSKDLFNYEFIYFRSEASDTGNSIQYVPFYNGSTGWQLYSAPEYQLDGKFSMHNWFHVTLLVKDNDLELFINYSQTPYMVIDLLRKDLFKGSMLLKSEFDPFYYSNLKIEKLTGGSTAKIEEKENLNHINNWLLSEQFVLNEPWAFWQSASFLRSIKGWKSIEADKNGIVNLSRYFEYPKDAVAAKTIIISETNTTRQLLFDYTHTLMIILNSEIIFYGKEMDHYGCVYDEEQKIDLSLHKGENELMFIINGDTELYGDGIMYQGRKQSANWGFIAKLGDYKGLVVQSK